MISSVDIQVRNLAYRRMAHYGYTPSQIDAAIDGEADMVTIAHLDEAEEIASWVAGLPRQSPRDGIDIPDLGALSLGELIHSLGQMDPAAPTTCTLSSPHSYRGFYEQVGFVLGGPGTVSDSLSAALSAVGATYEGWKGGNFTMDTSTECWVVRERGNNGELLGALLLAHLMLGAPPVGPLELLDLEFRALLDLVMCSDPTPVPHHEPTLNALLDRLAEERGYENWTVAFHEHMQVRP